MLLQVDVCWCSKLSFAQAFKTSLVTIMDSLQVRGHSEDFFSNLRGQHSHNFVCFPGASADKGAGLPRGPRLQERVSSATCIRRHSVCSGLDVVSFEGLDLDQFGVCICWLQHPAPRSSWHCIEFPCTP